MPEIRQQPYPEEGGQRARYSERGDRSGHPGGVARTELDENCVTLMPADRAATAELLNAVRLRRPDHSARQQGLIDFVRQNAHVPVIETGAGILPHYFDRDGDLKKEIAIVLNAKTRRVSVCNALDCLMFSIGTGSPTWPPYAAGRQKRRYPCRRRAWKALNGHYPAELLQPADEHSFGTEFLSYRMSVKTVDSVDEAIHTSRATRRGTAKPSYRKT